MRTSMSVNQIIEYCWWYLEHLQLILAAGAIFDIICWTAIAIYLNKRRVIGRSRGAANADATPPTPTPTLTTSGAPR
jgi:hypothetical protein